VPPRYAALVADLLAQADIRMTGRDVGHRGASIRSFTSVRSPSARSTRGILYDGWWDSPFPRPGESHSCSTRPRASQLSPFMPAGPRSSPSTIPNIPYVWPGPPPFLSRFRAYPGDRRDTLRGRNAISNTTACFSAST